MQLPFLNAGVHCSCTYFILIHHRNLVLLATEMFKILNKLSPEILIEVFEKKEEILIIFEVITLLEEVK